MVEFILVIHLLIALALVGSVLLQKSEGGALGIGGGGGGGGGGMFSARGAGSALTRTTAILAAAFFATSLTLTVMSARKAAPTSVFDSVPSATGTKKPDVKLPDLGPKKDPSKPTVPTN